MSVLICCCYWPCALMFSFSVQYRSTRESLQVLSGTKLDFPMSHPRTSVTSPLTAQLNGSTPYRNRKSPNYLFQNQFVENEVVYDIVENKDRVGNLFATAETVFKISRVGRKTFSKKVLKFLIYFRLTMKS